LSNLPARLPLKARLTNGVKRLLSGLCLGLTRVRAFFHKSKAPQQWWGRSVVELVEPMQRELNQWQADRLKMMSLLLQNRWLVFPKQEATTTTNGYKSECPSAVSVTRDLPCGIIGASDEKATRPRPVRKNGGRSTLRRPAKASRSVPSSIGQKKIVRWAVAARQAGEKAQAFQNLGYYVLATTWRRYQRACLAKARALKCRQVYRS
jgi:hypothetical protein